MALVKSIMVSQLVTVAPSDSVANAAKKMSENSIGAVLVVTDGRLDGLFSERDLLTRVIAQGKQPTDTKVGDVLTSSMVTVKADTHIRRCAELFREGAFRHLPVVDGDRPIGIVSARDFFQYLTEGLEKLINQKHYRDQIADGDDPYDHLGGAYDG